MALYNIGYMLVLLLAINLEAISAHEIDLTRQLEQLNFRKELSLQQNVPLIIPEDLKDDLIVLLNEYPNWDYDSCLNFTKTLLDVEKLLIQGFVTIGDVGLLAYNLLNCPNVNIVKAVTCYNSNLSMLKKTIDDIIVDIGPYVKNMKEDLSELRTEFKACVKKQAQNILPKHKPEK